MKILSRTYIHRQSRYFILISKSVQNIWNKDACAAHKYETIIIIINPLSNATHAFSYSFKFSSSLCEKIQRSSVSCTLATIALSRSNSSLYKDNTFLDFFFTCFIFSTCIDIDICYMCAWYNIYIGILWNARKVVERTFMWNCASLL